MKNDLINHGCGLTVAICVAGSGMALPAVAVQAITAFTGLGAIILLGRNRTYRKHARALSKRVHRELEPAAIFGPMGEAKAEMSEAIAGLTNKELPSADLIAQHWKKWEALAEAVVTDLGERHPVFKGPHRAVAVKVFETSFARLIDDQDFFDRIDPHIQARQLELLGEIKDAIPTTPEIEAAVARALQKHEAQQSDTARADPQAEVTFAAAARRTLQSAEPKDREAARALEEGRPIEAADQLMLAARQTHAEADDAAAQARKIALATADRYRRAAAMYYGVEDGKALKAYREAARLDTSDTWALIFLARLEQSHGNGLAAARAVLETARAQVQEERDRSVLFNELGNILMAAGNRDGALNAYRADLEIAERLAAADPGNAGWQRDLSVSHNEIGDTLMAAGDRDGALNAYRAGLEIAERLAAADPGHAEWQRDLIVSHAKLAQVSGDVAWWQAALKIAEQLAAEGKLAPVDEWMLEAFRAQVGAG